MALFSASQSRAEYNKLECLFKISDSDPLLSESDSILWSRSQESTLLTTTSANSEAEEKQCVQQQHKTD